MSEAAIAIRGLRHTFPGDRPVEVLDGVDLEAAPGAFVSLVGPSGCGKSTLLQVLAGLLAPDAGESLIEGRSTIGEPGLAAYMPQKDLLLPWRKAIGNAVLGAEIAGEPKEEARRHALDLFERFGLAGFEESWPSQLSGGMRQRLALLRTFLIPRHVLLLDEPFGALDAITRREMHQWLQEVWASDARTVLFVTHDVEEALILSDVAYVMTPRPAHMAARFEVDYPRPRLPSIVTEPGFVADKARLLAALDEGGTG
ncbi:MAG: ABC transporter ATP-binding protein [Dehalococcoidia bacterium]|nr:ABC transporter ATP-binding protein [Dehalococcoidia bacterium]MYA53304.1 ABC transporter ATP-binding protein [Dehalococcoidia bacterium]